MTMEMTRGDHVSRLRTFLIPIDTSCLDLQPPLSPLLLSIYARFYYILHDSTLYTFKVNKLTDEVLSADRANELYGKIPGKVFSPISYSAEHLTVSDGEVPVSVLSRYLKRSCLARMESLIGFNDMFFSQNSLNSSLENHVVVLCYQHGHTNDNRMLSV